MIKVSTERQSDVAVAFALKNIDSIREAELRHWNQEEARHG